MSHLCSEGRHVQTAQAWSYCALAYSRDALEGYPWLISNAAKMMLVIVQAQIMQLQKDASEQGCRGG